MNTSENNVPNDLTYAWDHKTKPSTMVVRRGDREVFRGSFNEAMHYIEDQKRIAICAKMLAERWWQEQCDGFRASVKAYAKELGRGNVDWSI